MRNWFKSGFVMFIIVSVAVLLMAAAAYAQAQGGSAGGCGDGVCMNVGCLALNCAAPESWENCPQDCPASCSDGFKNQDETGVDCGGSCILGVNCVGVGCVSYTVDYCDGKDNDKDCLVDEDCKPQRQPVAAPQPIKSQPPANQQAKPSCSDGLKNQDEVGVNCGGVCVTNDAELCDGVDNDRDCQIDEAEECKKTQASTSTPQESVSASVPMPVQQPVSAPVPESVTAPETSQAQPAQSIPAEEAPSSKPALADGSSGLSQGDSTLQTSQITQFAKKNSMFQGKEPTEKDTAGALKQFSEETYQNPEPKPQAQGFFSKVKTFFKRLFG